MFPKFNIHHGGRLNHQEELEIIGAFISKEGDFKWNEEAKGYYWEYRYWQFFVYKTSIKYHDLYENEFEIHINIR